MRRIEVRTILAAATAGGISALASSLTAIIAHRHFPIGDPSSTTRDLVAYWSWVGGVTLVASIFEITFLYWDALRAVHHMACAAGYPVDARVAKERDAEVVSSLARAALELPNPLITRFGINPRREASVWFVTVASLLYKAKIALTTFLAKALLRGALGRATARALLELVAIPVTAIWNAIVCFVVLREARLRILGPSAVSELLDVGLQLGEVTRRGWQVALRATASAVVRTRDFHPNHVALLRALTDQFTVAEIAEPDDPSRFLEELSTLSRADQSFVLHVLVTAAILDGRTTRAERRLLEQAFAICRRVFDPQAVHAAMIAFRNGQPVVDAIRVAVQ